MQIDRNALFDDALKVALAAFGGLIGALMRREAATFRDAAVGSCGAAFVGLLVAKLCHGSGLSDDNTFVCVGVAGWLGATRTIAVLQRIIENFPLAGLKSLPQDKPTDKDENV